MSDKDQIKSCIDLYYEGCCESDSSKIKKAFDENAMISGYLPDGRGGRARVGGLAGQSE